MELHTDLRRGSRRTTFIIYWGQKENTNYDRTTWRFTTKKKQKKPQIIFMAHHKEGRWYMLLYGTHNDVCVKTLKNKLSSKIVIDYET